MPHIDDQEQTRMTLTTPKIFPSLIIIQHELSFKIG